MPATPSTALLHARGLVFLRDEAAVFGPLDLRVDAGQALLVQGGNGAGKTTLLRVLAGLLRADAGTLALAGQPASAQARSRAMAYLSHLPGLKADLSAAQNLSLIHI